MLRKYKSRYVKGVFVSCEHSFILTGYSVSAQRQLFGGGGRPQQSSSKVSFGQNQNPYKWVASDAKQQGQAGAQQQISASDIVYVMLCSCKQVKFNFS